MIDRRAYYAHVRELATIKRVEFSVRTEGFGLTQIRNIYRRENITIDSRPLNARVRAIYMCGDGDCSVAIRRDLPKEPKIFALIHELKHHWLDRLLMESGQVSCGSFNENELHEKAAEVFAAEFLYPENEFRIDMYAFEEAQKIQNWQCDDIVHFRRNACRASVSYTFIRKRLEWLQKIAPAQFQGVKFQKREDELYGVPIYRQPWFIARRKAKAAISR